MGRLWAFFPENDLALAFGGRHFTAPAAAVALRRAGESLMSWVAAPGDFYLAENGGDDVGVCSLSPVGRVWAPGKVVESVSPWGWSLAAKEFLANAGIEGRLLMPDDRIERLRQLSHRRTSIAVNRELRRRGLATPPEATEITSLPSARSVAAECRTVFKSPWSSSGRGVMDSATVSPDTLEGFISGTIRRQGSVIAEPWLDKVLDFAMLFESCGGRIYYAGLSLFHNERETAYQGNVVAKEQLLRQMLGEYVPESKVDIIAENLAEVLTGVVANDYEGYMGVDMMVWRDGRGEVSIAPCVELNLRMTMGVVAMKLADRYLDAGSTGGFRIVHGTAPRLMPPVVADGRLVSGEVLLTAANDDFNFVFSADRRMSRTLTRTGERGTACLSQE